MTKRLLALLLLTAGCAVGPGYHRPELGMPATWRKSAPSSDSLRPFYDSLRTSRDTLLPPGADTARVAFAYDTTARRSAARSAPTPPRIYLLQESLASRL